MCLERQRDDVGIASNGAPMAWMAAPRPCASRKVTPSITSAPASPASRAASASSGVENGSRWSEGTVSRWIWRTSASPMLPYSTATR
ncbi:MAG: hypothetical protein R2856_05350 [Caldilineaceae bacterium]